MIAFVGLLLSGCESLLQDSEERINAAIPMASDIERSMSEAIEYAGPERRKVIEDELTKRLKVRALTCSNGYTPSWHTSDEEIRKELHDRSCFNEKDIELARWLGFLRVSMILAEQPIRPIADSHQKFYVADESIQWVYPASQAGVMLVTLNKGIQIFDLETGDTIFKEINETKMRGGEISANGRLFTIGNNEQLLIRRSDTGDIVVSLPGVGVRNFHWFGERGALYRREDNQQYVLIDLVTGKEAPFAGVLGSILRIVPDGDNKSFLISTTQGLSRVEVKWSGEAPSMKLLADVALSDRLSSGLWCLTSDEVTYIAGRDSLHIVATDSFEREDIPLAPFNIMRMSATPDPDKIIINGFIRDVSASDNQHYYYSIQDRSFALIDKDDLISVQYLYIPALNSLVAISRNRVVVFDDPPSAEPVDIKSFISDANMRVNQKKLEDFDRQQAYSATGSRPIVVWTEPASIPVKPMLDIPHDAKIEAIGVYQGGGEGARPREPRKTTNVDVRVRRSEKPVVLVLSSYEPVLWRVVAEPGARLDAVLVSGNHASQVIGAGSTRTIVLGTAYAYERSNPGYLKLDNEVFRMTGKRISLFQGSYEGAQFIVGGTDSR